MPVLDSTAFVICLPTTRFPLRITHTTCPYVLPPLHIYLPFTLLPVAVTGWFTFTALIPHAFYALPVVTVDSFCVPGSGLRFCTVTALHRTTHVCLRFAVGLVYVTRLFCCSTLPLVTVGLHGSLRLFTHFTCPVVPGLHLTTILLLPHIPQFLPAYRLLRSAAHVLDSTYLLYHTATCHHTFTAFYWFTPRVPFLLVATTLFGLVAAARLRYALRLPYTVTVCYFRHHHLPHCGSFAVYNMPTWFARVVTGCTLRCRFTAHTVPVPCRYAIPHAVQVTFTRPAYAVTTFYTVLPVLPLGSPLHFTTGSHAAATPRRSGYGSRGYFACLRWLHTCTLRGCRLPRLPTVPRPRYTFTFPAALHCTCRAAFCRGYRTVVALFGWFACGSHARTHAGLGCGYRATVLRATTAVTGYVCGLIRGCTFRGYAVAFAWIALRLRLRCVLTCRFVLLPAFTVLLRLPHYHLPFYVLVWFWFAVRGCRGFCHAWLGSRLILRFVRFAFARLRTVAVCRLPAVALVYTTFCRLPFTYAHTRGCTFLHIYRYLCYTRFVHHGCC